jgi:tRNA U34 5-carboxymethylaminomethyl modifying GTPase MnmE/TrmE
MDSVLTATTRNLELISVTARYSSAPGRRDFWCNSTARSLALGEGLSAEYVAVDLDEALRSVGEVIGVADVEQILDSVFSQFCIGK